jgi:3-hydroxy-9,10-secoandrosta-1,3,5(10)-triene-9,17-dione monooxygenase
MLKTNRDNYDDMLDRARSLIPAFRKAAPEAEKLRRLPIETEKLLHETGLFRILQPKRVGGSEFDYVALVDFAAEAAKGDASVGWNLANLGSHHWMLGMFPRQAQDLLWNEDPDVLIASSFVFPCGKAKKVTGGYELSGRWPFSSGVNPSRWNMLAGTVTSDDEADAAELRIFLVHESTYETLDNWDPMGLRGTGSHDVIIEKTFVEDHMTLAVRDIAGGPSPGSDINPNVLYKLPVFALFPFVLTGVALGNAQACLKDYIDATRTRASQYNRAKIGDFQSTQIKIASSSARIDTGRDIMRSICINATQDAKNGHIPDLATKTRYRRDGAFSVNLCTEAVGILFGASGAGGLMRGQHMEKQFRDAHAINSHIAFSFDVAGSNFGRVALGLPSENPTL